jgi:hypothetical protein
METHHDVYSLHSVLNACKGSFRAHPLANSPVRHSDGSGHASQDASATKPSPASDWQAALQMLLGVTADNLAEFIEACTAFIHTHNDPAFDNTESGHCVSSGLPDKGTGSPEESPKASPQKPPNAIGSTSGTGPMQSVAEEDD